MEVLAFECIATADTYHSSVTVQPYRVALWSAAFGVESLEGLFDMTPAADAIGVIDAAIARFNTDPEGLRALVDPADQLGLFGNRRVLLKLRTWLADNGGTITGAIDDEAPA
ncbi:hypothetical protein ACFRAM_28590, partial [Paenibacillus sp. NPDC056722]|uniref:hypothetical protein n=1 Tax=Paenibacillus sp. NPDC056722 TaxID=3345924 RepID=UPI00368B9063